MNVTLKSELLEDWRLLQPALHITAYVVIAIICIITIRSIIQVFKEK